MYSVPSNFSSFITQVSVILGKGDEVNIEIIRVNQTPRIPYTIAKVIAYQSQSNLTGLPPVRIIGGSDLFIQSKGTGSGGGSQISVSAQSILIDEDEF